MEHPEKPSQPVGNKRIIFPLALALMCLLVLVVVYLVSVVVRGNALYEQTNYRSFWLKGDLHTDGQMMQMDAQLGYRLAPGATGNMLAIPGLIVPFANDDEGLRVVPGVTHQFNPGSHPTLLFLGDSFTYGQLVPMQHTFAHLVGEQLHAQSLDAGTPGYGLAEMVLQARAVISAYRPDIVVVQYSPWLTDRAVFQYAPDVHNFVPVPYYYQSQDGAMHIAPPIYTLSTSLSKQVNKYHWTPLDLQHRLAFITEAALHFYPIRDTGIALYNVKKWLGLAPPPAHDLSALPAVVKAAYGEIDRLAHAQGAKLVILVLGDAANFEMPKAGSFPQDALVVNAWQAMTQQLHPADASEYLRQYCIWGGNPPQVIDWHPNEHAHQIIAETLVAAIRKVKLAGL